MKLGIIGTGKIVTDALYAMQPVSAIRKKAIFARPHSRGRAEAFAAQYGIPEVYTDYEQLLEKADVDTVYIGLVNTAHYEYAKKALLHDRNVILEKPFVLSGAEAEKLKQIAEERRLFLLEAITVLHNPVYDYMKRNMGKLGKVKLMQCNYSQYSSRYDEYLKGEVAPAFDPALQGGSLRDINVYNIHYCAALFGLPQKVRYDPNRGFNGVDTSGVLVLSYPGLTCVCTAAKDSDSPGFVSIQGEKGWMKIDGKPNAPANLTVVSVCGGESAGTDEYDSPTGAGTHTQGGNPAGRDAGPTQERDASGAVVRKTVRETYQAPDVHHRMTQEFTDFARIIDEKDYKSAAALLEETVNVVRILEEASESL